MSLRSWLLERLGNSAPNDPERMVELTTVAPYEVPILQEMLSQVGINSNVTETFDAVFRGDYMSCITVRSADFETATQALRDFKS